MKRLRELRRYAFNFFLLGILIVNIIFLLTLFYAGTIYGKSHLTIDEKQKIAVEYLCNGRWDGVQIFCGQQVVKGK